MKLIPYSLISMLFASIGFHSFAQQQLFSTPGTHTFVPHPSVIELNVEAIGAGGAGGRVTNASIINHKVGGGGGGGAYVFSYVPVVGGNSYNVVVGAGGYNNTNGSEAHGGDSYFDSGADARAKGGNTKLGDGENYSPGALGGSAASSNARDLTGTVGTSKKFSGGNGGAGDDGPVDGGGGGGAAGSAGNGSNGQNYGNPLGGIRGPGDLLNLSTPGNGGNGAQDGGTGGAGAAAGGGGGGSSAQSSSNRNGGAGANGIVLLSWSRIDSLSPSSACAGFSGTVTIHGFNFSTTSANGTPVNTTSVTYDGQPVAYTVVNNSEITFTLPAGAGAGNVIVTTTYGRAQSYFSLNTPSTVPSSLTANNSICLGDSITLTANGGTLGSGAQYYWYSGSCGGTLLGTTTTNTYTFTPNAAGTHTYFVRLAGACDTTACVSASVTVFDGPDIATITDQTVCAGTTFSEITPTSTTAGATFSWTNNNTSIGLAAAGTGNIPSFTAVNAGTTATTALVSVTPNANGCPGTPITFNITVNPLPTVDAISDQTLCNGSTSAPVTITGPVAGTVYGWTNDEPSIGLGALGTGNIASFTAENTGNSPITATVTILPLANGCTGTPVSFTYTVNPGPSMNPISDLVICNGVSSAVISPSSPVAGSTYSWTNSNPAIGLPASGTGDIPSFTAVNAGTAPITATVTVTPTAAGCVGNPITFTITVNPSPQVSFNASPVVCANEQVQFNNTSNDAVSYLWDFGDGSTSTEENPFHEYANLANTYTVTLTITHANGCSQSLQQSIQTLPNPTAGFTASPMEASVLNGQINFTNTSQGENSWSWDFGNGSTSSVENPSYTYTTPGTYTVVLAVFNIHQCTDTFSLQITIFDEIQVPNVFTPNDDGINDTFSFLAHTAQQVDITVFNRWGNIVFKGNDPSTGWDGKQNGQNSPDGVYFYVVRVTTSDGTVQDHTGTVTLVR